MSDVVFLIIIIVLLGAVMFLLATRKKKEETSDIGGSFALLQNQMSELMRTVDAKLGESHNASRTQWSESQKLISDINRQVSEQLLSVTKAVTETNEGSKQVLGVADQIRSLEKILTHQKQRGAWGEASLKLTLESSGLPPTAYAFAHQFNNGEVVDAVVFTKEGIIPVDAKFSLDNYTRITDEIDESKKADLEKDFKNDLKRRIDETAKYIRPEEGTLPFAMMFIPAEGIYYDLLVNEVGAVKINTRSLIDYAYNDKNVIIVSPTTFAAYLQSVLYGFRAFKIEESAKMIRKNVEMLGKHLKAYEEYFRKLGDTLGTSVSHYNTAYKELAKVDKDVLKITGEAAGVEALTLEKPERGE
ncbi:DNA recombination protein RmuC [bacterium]|nr:DNA recombination protein RmuC [bacterium]